MEPLYEFGCPRGVWYARLDRKAWGDRQNLRLSFTDLETGQKRFLSVFWSDHPERGYRPRRGGPDFHREADIGDCFRLVTAHTKKGTPNLLRAAPCPESDAFTGLRLPDIPLRITIVRRQTRLFASFVLAFAS